MSLHNAVAALAAADQVILTTHVGPDGDGIGTCLALRLGLEGLGKRVRLIFPGKIPATYRFLPGFDQIVGIKDDTAATALVPEIAATAATVVLSCDAGDLRRLGQVQPIVAAVRAAGGKLINLDHHATNDRFGDINLVDVAGESSGVVADELLAAIHLRAGRTWQPGVEAAACLYTTIIYDTGRFMHSNTTPRCLRWTAALMECGIDASAINRALTYTRTAQDMQVQRLALEHLAVDAETPGLAGITLRRAAIDTIGDPEDWGDLVELPRTLAGNQVAFVLRETKDGKIRASLRSNPPLAISGVAMGFGGGGHAQAASFTAEGKLDDLLPLLLPKLRAVLGKPS